MAKGDKEPSTRRGPRLPAGNARKEVTGTPSRGKVSRITHGRSDGYIRTIGGEEIYFHRSDVAEEFNRLEVGTDVTFEVIEDHISGARAVRVRTPPATKRT